MRNILKVVFIAIFCLGLLSPLLSAENKTDRGGTTLKFYIDTSQEMQRGDIVYAVAGQLAEKIKTLLTTHKFPENFRIIVEAFCTKDGKLNYESRFTYRVGQKEPLDFSNLNDRMEMPDVWFEDNESSLNLLINRDAWPVDLKNANTVVLILTNSSKLLSDDDVKKINESAKSNGSFIKQIKLPRPNEYSNVQALAEHLDKLLSPEIDSAIKPPPSPPSSPPEAKEEISKIKPTAKFDLILPLIREAPDMKVKSVNQSKDAEKYLWDFGQGKSNEVNPEFVYKNPGEYNISLTVTSKDGLMDTYVYPQKIIVKPGPGRPTKANFDVEPKSGTAPLTVTFTNTSENAVKFIWDFGDNEKSEDKSPKLEHKYQKRGNYRPSLTAISTDGKSDPKLLDGEITVEEPPPPQNIDDQKTPEDEANINKSEEVKPVVVPPVNKGGGGNIGKIIILMFLAFLIAGLFIWHPWGQKVEMKLNRNGEDVGSEIVRVGKELHLSRFGSTKDMSVRAAIDKDDDNSLKVQFKSRAEGISLRDPDNRLIDLNNGVWTDTYRLGKYEIVGVKETLEINEANKEG